MNQILKYVLATILATSLIIFLALYVYQELYLNVLEKGAMRLAEQQTAQIIKGDPIIWLVNVETNQAEPYQLLKACQELYGERP